MSHLGGPDALFLCNAQTPSATPSSTQFLRYLCQYHWVCWPAWAIERERTNVAQSWLSAADTAAHLGMTEDTNCTWIAEKAIPAPEGGRLWKFQTSKLDDWVRAGSAVDDS